MTPTLYHSIGLAVLAVAALGAAYLQIGTFIGKAPNSPIPYYAVAALILLAAVILGVADTMASTT